MFELGEVIPHWLTKQAFLAPDKCAIETERGESIHFKELKLASEKYARKLAQIGVKKGDRVGILSTNRIPMIITIHALSYLGAVAVLLNTRLTEQELRYQIDDAGVSLTLYDGQSEYTQEMCTSNHRLYTFSEIDQFDEKRVALQEELDLDDAFTVIYTSGTTGAPKGVVHTYGNHWWSAIGSALNLGLHENDKWLATLPIFHVGGLSIFIKSVMYGMPVYLLEKFAAKTINEAIETKGVTIVSVVTMMLQRLLSEREGRRYPETFRCMLLGGGPAPLPLLEQAKEHHIPVFQSYGMTETSSQMVTLSPEHALKKLGSAGKALFPGQLRINEQGEDGVGEVFVKGPMVTKGYLHNPIETEKALRDGWLATGDLGYLDEDGFLYIVERRTDLIISGGENIYPSEIESVLTGMMEIKEVGVVGKRDETWGQVPVAFVVTNTNTVTKQAISTYAAPYLAAYKRPKEIYFIDQLPRNAANKLVRKELLHYIKKDNEA